MIVLIALVLPNAILLWTCCIRYACTSGLCSIRDALTLELVPLYPATFDASVIVHPLATIVSTNSLALLVIAIPLYTILNHFGQVRPIPSGLDSLVSYKSDSHAQLCVGVRNIYLCVGLIYHKPFDSKTIRKPVRHCRHASSVSGCGCRTKPFAINTLSTQRDIFCVYNLNNVSNHRSSL